MPPENRGAGGAGRARPLAARTGQEVAGDHAAAAGDRQQPDGGAGHQARGQLLRRRGAAADREPLRARGERDPADVQAPVPGPGADRAVLVHRQRHDPADRAGVDPVRRGDHAPGRLADPAAGRGVVHRRRERARGRPAGQPDHRGAADLRRGRLGDLRGHRLPHDPRRDAGHGGDGRLAHPAPDRAPGAGRDVRRGAAQRPGVGGRRARRLLLLRVPAARHPRRRSWPASPRSRRPRTCSSARSRR